MNTEKIGKLIQEKRQEKKMTQEELASLLHVSNKTISKWETGRGVPSIELLMPICEVFDMELKELLSGEKDTTYENILIEELKRKKKINFMKLVGGIILCLFLCFLETILYIANVDTKIATIIFISFILVLLLFDIIHYFANKK